MEDGGGGGVCTGRTLGAAWRGAGVIGEAHMLSIIWPTGRSIAKWAPRMTCKLRMRMTKLAKKTYGTKGMRRHSMAETMKMAVTHIWHQANVNHSATMSTTVMMNPLSAGYAKKMSQRVRRRGGGHLQDGGGGREEQDDAGEGQRVGDGGGSMRMAAERATSSL